MESKKDAAYAVMMNKELRYEFLEIYSEFPALYDKYTKKTKTYYPKRIYASNMQDFYKIIGVFFEAEKDSALMDRIANIFLLHVRGIVINLLVNAGSDIRNNYTDRVKEMFQILSYQIYYEYHFLYVYFYTHSNVIQELDYDDPMKACLSSLNTRTFKEISDDYTRYYRTNAAKNKFENKWEEIYETARECFETPHLSKYRWAPFIRSAKDPSEVEKKYTSDMEAPALEFSPLVKDENILSSIEKYSKEKNELKPRGFSVNLAFTYEIILEVMQLIKLGIDAPMIILKHPLKSKEIRDIVYNIKHLRELRGLKEPSSLSEWRECIGNVCKVCIEEILVKNYLASLDGNYKEEKIQSSAKHTSLDSTLLNLKDENEKLTSLLVEKDKKISSITKEAKDDKKELLAQIYELKQKLKEYEPDEEVIIKDSIFLVSEDEADRNEPEQKNNYTEDDFKEFIKNHKILVWGLRDKTAKKFQELYPELSFADTDRPLKSQQVKKYDAIIINTTYTSHSKYFTARDTIKAAGLPFAVLGSGTNNQSQLWKAAEELESKM